MEQIKSFFAGEHVRIAFAMLVTFLSTLGVNLTLPVRHDPFTGHDGVQMEKHIKERENEFQLKMEVLQLRLESKIMALTEMIKQSEFNKPPQATRERIESLEDAMKQLDKKYSIPTRKWN